MKAQRKVDELEQLRQAKVASNKIDAEIQEQKRQQREISAFRAWSLRNLLPGHVVLFSLVDEELRRALVQSDMAIKQSVGASQSAKKIVFKAETNKGAANKGGKIDFRGGSKLVGKIAFRPSPVSPSSFDEQMRKTKQTVKERRIQFRPDVANLNGPTPKALVENAKKKLRDHNNSQDLDNVVKPSEENIAANSLQAPSAYDRKKKKRFGLGR